MKMEQQMGLDKFFEAGREKRIKFLEEAISKASNPDVVKSLQKELEITKRGGPAYYRLCNSK